MGGSQRNPFDSPILARRNTSPGQGETLSQRAKLRRALLTSTNPVQPNHLGFGEGLGRHVKYDYQWEQEEIFSMLHEIHACLACRASAGTLTSEELSESPMP